VSRLLATGLLAAAAVSALAPSALADASSFALRPVSYQASNPVTQSYFVLAARPGQTIRSKVRVTNAGTASGSALLYAVDATTGQTSGAVYRARTSSRRDVGSWLRLGFGRVTLAPGESRLVAFAVVVPAHVRPGQHLGGIVAENLTVDNGAPSHGNHGGSFRIRVRHLTIVAVEVNLPGPPVERITLAGVKASRIGAYPTIVLSLRNEGTVMLKPHGAVRLIGADGRVVERRAFALDTFLPKTAIDYPLVLHERLAPGTYRAAVDLEYGQDHTLRVARPLIVGRSVSVVRAAAAPPPSPTAVTSNQNALPWLVAIAGIAVGIAGALIALRARRRV